MKIIDCVQGQPEWWEAKCGVPSASQFHRIFAAGSGKLSGSVDAYAAELIEERTCHTPKYFTGQGKPITPDMQRGIDREPDARTWYEGQIKRRVWTVGFITTDDGRFGCSPDFMVGEEGAGEIKIYDPKLHDTWVAKDVLPNQFAAQVHGQLFVTGLPWIDLVLWNPDRPGRVIRTVPDATTRALRVALEQFWERYASAWNKIGGAA